MVPTWSGSDPVIPRFIPLRPCARKVARLSSLLLLALLPVCDTSGIDYLPPEELRPVTQAVPPAPAAKAEVSPPAPAGTAAVALAAEPADLKATCGGCHPLDTLAKSAVRGAAWAAFLDKHAADGFISPTAGEKAALASRLGSVYPK